MKVTILKNKGFSLVELIIVIAIMAILIAVLAPMFLRYVERSRVTTDVNAVGSMARVLRSAAVDTQLAQAPPTLITLTWATDTAGTISVSTSISSLDYLYEDAVHNAIGASEPMRSQAARSEGPIEIEIQSVPGIVEVRLAAGEVSTLTTELAELLVGLK